MSSPLTEQIDPLDSPHPIPWNWVMANLNEASSLPSAKLRFYRSQSIISPDKQYAAYSRIQMQLKPEFGESCVSSVLFVENLKTRELQSIAAASPLAEHPFIATERAEQVGAISILIPISWSETSSRILAREFESLLGSDLASDYAVVWERSRNHTYTLAPTRIAYTTAVLLGWSQTYPERVLFRAGILGEEHWPLWTVDLEGQTFQAVEDQPRVFGQVFNSIWTGPQL